jgi:hypothetical protein
MAVANADESYVESCVKVWPVGYEYRVLLGLLTNVSTCKFKPIEVFLTVYGFEERIKGEVSGAHFEQEVIVLTIKWRKSLALGKWGTIDIFYDHSLFLSYPELQKKATNTQTMLHVPDTGKGIYLPLVTKGQKFRIGCSSAYFPKSRFNIKLNLKQGVETIVKDYAFAKFIYAVNFVKTLMQKRLDKIKIELDSKLSEKEIYKRKLWVAATKTGLEPKEYIGHVLKTWLDVEDTSKASVDKDIEFNRRFTYIMHQLAFGETAKSVEMTIVCRPKEEKPGKAYDIDEVTSGGGHERELIHFIEPLITAVYALMCTDNIQNLLNVTCAESYSATTKKVEDFYEQGSVSMGVSEVPATLRRTMQKCSNNISQGQKGESCEDTIWSILNSVLKGFTHVINHKILQSRYFKEFNNLIIGSDELSKFKDRYNTNKDKLSFLEGVAQMYLDGELKVEIDAGWHRSDYMVGVGILSYYGLEELLRVGLIGPYPTRLYKFDTGMAIIRQPGTGKEDDIVVVASYKNFKRVFAFLIKTIHALKDVSKTYKDGATNLKELETRAQAYCKTFDDTLDECFEDTVIAFILGDSWGYANELTDDCETLALWITVYMSAIQSVLKKASDAKISFKADERLCKSKNALMWIFCKAAGHREVQVGYMNQTSKDGGGHGWAKLIAFFGTARDDYLNHICVVLGGTMTTNHEYLNRVRCPNVEEVEEGTIDKGKGDLYCVSFFEIVSKWSRFEDFCTDIDAMLDLQRNAAVWTRIGDCGYDPETSCPGPKVI